MDAGHVLFRGVLISSDELHTLTVKKDEEKAKRRDRLFYAMSFAVTVGLIILSAIVYWPGR